MFAGLRKKWRDQIGQTKTILGEKVREALASVVPITLIVLILCFTAAPVPTDVLLAFLVGAVLLIVGMGLFTLGADTAMLPIGERVGAQMTKSRKLWVVVCVSLLIGIIVTISEPDLQVLAGQVPGIPNAVLIGAVAVGVGIFLVVALLRILFQIPLNGLLIASYIVIFTLAAFAPKDFLAVAFDSGGVTTGPMTVPFIMALGLGVSSTRSDGKAGEDSFGLVALCSVGPVLAVLTLALAYPAAGSYVPSVVPEAGDSRELWRLFAQGLPVYAKEMGAALAPIAAFFAVFQVTSLHLPRKNVLKITVGLLYTYIGLVLFMTGVNVGFLPAGSYLGRQIAALEQSWVLIPIGMLVSQMLSLPEDWDFTLAGLLDPHRYADGLVHRAGGACRPCAEPAGGGADLRGYPRQGHEHQPVHRRGGVHWSRHAACADGRFYFCPAGAGIPVRHRLILRGAEDLHRHRLRLRRRGLWSHDGHVSAALCYGGL